MLFSTLRKHENNFFLTQYKRCKNNAQSHRRKYINVALFLTCSETKNIKLVKVNKNIDT